MSPGTDMQIFLLALRSCAGLFFCRKKENPYQIRTVPYQIMQVPYHFLGADFLSLSWWFPPLNLGDFLPFSWLSRVKIFPALSCFHWWKSEVIHAALLHVIRDRHANFFADFEIMCRAVFCPEKDRITAGEKKRKSVSNYASSVSNKDSSVSLPEADFLSSLLHGTEEIFLWFPLISFSSFHWWKSGSCA